MSAGGWSWGAWVLVGTSCAVALATPSVRLPSDELGLRGFRTPPVAPEVRLGQTFTMTADGLYAVDVFGAAVGEQVSGAVRLELYDATFEPRRLLRSAEVSAAEFVAASPYRFEFPPVADSKNRVFRLDVASSDTSVAEGVALRATKGDRYDGGAMLINDSIRWADLAFETHAPAPSIWSLLLRMRETSGVRGEVVAAALLVTGLLVGVVLQTLATLPEDVPRLSR